MVVGRSQNQVIDSEGSDRFGREIVALHEGGK